MLLFKWFIIAFRVKKKKIGLIFPPAFLSDSVSRNSSSIILLTVLQPHWASFRTLNVPRASVLALLSSWDILPQKIHMTGFISSHHGCANSSVCFSKRPSLPFQWKHINHCSILSACMFSLWYHSEITFWNFLIRLFMNTACFLPQNVSYTKAETSSSSLPSWLGTSQDFNNFFFF